MRVLLTSTWGFGHTFPLVPLARALVAAGHEVLWATNEQATELVTAAGIPCRAAGLDTQGVHDVERRLRQRLADVAPQDKASVAFPTMFGEWVAPVMASDLLPLAREWGPDLIVHENAELAAPLIGAALGVPVVTHAFGGGVPPAFVADAGERLAPLWKQCGQEPRPYAGCYAAGFLDICPTSLQTQPLDHVGHRMPMRPLNYTGESGPRVDLSGDGPLVYLTLGTVQNHAHLLEATAAVLARLDARLLVTVGHDGDPAPLHALGDHVRAEHWVCQSDVLPFAAVVVSHGGSGTVLGAASQGLAQVCLPQAADQFRNGSAVEAAGAGLSLHPSAVSPESVTEAVRRVLAEPSFRDGATAVAAEIAALPSPESVVAELERLSS